MSKTHLLFASALMLSIVVIPATVASQPARADAPSGAGGLFVPDQARVLNTTTGVGGYSTPMAAGGWRNLTLTGNNNVPTGATAVQVNFTALNATSSGIIHADKAGVTPASTTVSYLNYGIGTADSNSAVLPLNSSGQIQVSASTVTDLVIDLQGYYSPGATGPGGFIPVSPVTIASTAAGSGGLSTAQVVDGQTATVPLAGVGPIPSAASAVMIELTEAISSSTEQGSVSAYPSGQSVPNTSLTWPAGRQFSWSIPIALSSTSTGVKIYVRTGGPLNLGIAVLGYFTAGSAGYGQMTPIAQRLYDSRVSPAVAIAANSTRNIPVAGVGGLPDATGILAIIINLHALPTTSGSGSLKMYADDETDGLVTTRWTAGAPDASMSVVRVGAGGGVVVANTSSVPVNVVLDGEGWYASDGNTAPDFGVMDTSGANVPDGTTYTNSQLAAMGVNVTTIDGMANGTVPLPSATEYPESNPLTPTQQSTNEATSSDDTAAAPSSAKDDVLDQWTDVINGTTYYRRGYWTGSRGFGDAKITQYHNLNKRAVKAVSTKGVWAPSGGQSVAFYGDFHHVHCTGWWIFGTCKVVKTITVTEITDYRSYGPYPETFGVVNAYCLGYTKCPDWVKNALNI